MALKFGTKKVNGVCYMFSVRSKKSWTEAREDCRKLGSGYDLVKIVNKKANDAIRTYIRRKGKREDYWIGFNDRTLEGHFNWADGVETYFGTEYTRYPWGSDEPNSVSLYFK